MKSDSPATATQIQKVAGLLGLAVLRWQRERERSEKLSNSLPERLPTHTDAVALGGVGDSVTRLRDVRWLRTCQLYYWGDLDVDGFRILANVRKLFPEVKSLLMDRETFEAHRTLVVAGNGKICESLPMLSESENAVLRILSDGNLRLEQERIIQAWVESSLSSSPIKESLHRFDNEGSA